MLVVRTGSGSTKRRPSKPYVSAAIANLQPGRSLVLERAEEDPGDWYIQVWMREGNTFQLEHRDGVPSEHYMTLTVSREKVIAAMLGWMKGERDWRESFMWDNIGSKFADGAVPDACPSGGDRTVNHGDSGRSTPHRASDQRAGQRACEYSDSQADSSARPIDPRLHELRCQPMSPLFRLHDNCDAVAGTQGVGPTKSSSAVTSTCSGSPVWSWPSTSTL